MIDPTLFKTPEGIDQIRALLKARGDQSSHVRQYDTAIIAARDDMKIIQASQERIQELSAQRNKLSAEIKNLNDPSLETVRATAVETVKNIKKEISKITQKVTEREQRNVGRTQILPNILSSKVPIGHNATKNVLYRQSHKQPTLRDGKTHTELGIALGMMDFEQTAKISGSGFVTLKGQLAQLERALSSYMIDVLTSHGFVEHSVPALANRTALFGTGQLPKFEDDLYGIGDEQDQDDPYEPSNTFLIPTSEVTLTNTVMDTITDADKLPLLLCASTPCFRREAGSAGRNTRGMIRLHQFQKVEMVAITKPEESDAMHHRMLDVACSMLEELEIPYRVMLLCSGDTGFSAQMTYDIEVWLPADNDYREISSISNCGDFQARRMKARYRDKGGKGGKLVHTLNGSGLAIGRTIVAIMENYQKEDGRIEIPRILRPYMNNKVWIG